MSSFTNWLILLLQVIRNIRVSLKLHFQNAIKTLKKTAMGAQMGAANYIALLWVSQAQNGCETLLYSVECACKKNSETKLQ